LDTDYAPLKIWTEDEFAWLNQHYDFYQQTTEDGAPLTGQYMAVPKDQTPQRKGDTYQVSVVAPLESQRNFFVDYATVTTSYLGKAQQVVGKNPAQTVAKTHDKLISFLINVANAHA
jgi:hypothetical protein